jgi:hypothetical protein
MSTRATLARRATLRKRSHQRRPQTETSTAAWSAVEHPATASLPQARIDPTEPAMSTTPPRSSCPTPSSASVTPCPTHHRRFPSAESHRRRLPCMVSPVVPFHLRRVPSPSLVPPCTTLPRLIAGDGRNQSANYWRGKGGGVPHFRFGLINFGPEE